MKYLREVKLSGRPRSWWSWPTPEVENAGLLEKRKFDQKKEAADYIRPNLPAIEAYFKQGTLDGAIDKLAEDPEFMEKYDYEDILRHLRLLAKVKLYRKTRFGRQKLANLEPSSVRWINSVTNRTCSPGVASMRNKGFRKILKQAYKEGWTEADYSGLVKNPDANPGRPKQYIGPKELDDLCLYFFSKWSTRSSGILTLIAYDTKSTPDPSLKWEDLDGMELSEPTKATIENHKKDWGFQEWVAPSPKVDPLRDGYLPMAINTYREHFKDACEQFGYDFIPSDFCNSPEDIIPTEEEDY